MAVSVATAASPVVSSGCSTRAGYGASGSRTRRACRPPRCPRPSRRTSPPPGPGRGRSRRRLRRPAGPAACGEPSRTRTCRVASSQSTATTTGGPPCRTELVTSSLTSRTASSTTSLWCSAQVEPRRNSRASAGASLETGSSTSARGVVWHIRWPPRGLVESAHRVRGGASSGLPRDLAGEPPGRRKDPPRARGTGRRAAAPRCGRAARRPAPRPCAPGRCRPPSRWTEAATWSRQPGLAVTSSWRRWPAPTWPCARPARRRPAGTAGCRPRPSRSRCPASATSRSSSPGIPRSRARGCARTPCACPRWQASW